MGRTVRIARGLFVGVLATAVSFSFLEGVDAARARGSRSEIDLARRILASCERRRPELIIPGKARLLFAVQQLFPSLGDWIVGKKT